MGFHDSMQTHLPSKTFLIRGGIATLIVVGILVAQTNWFRNLLHKEPKPTLSELRVGDIVGADSNGNGIADWEEQLWGLDPTQLYTNGTPNAEIIRQKKLALGIENPSNIDPNNSTDTIAQKLFVLSTALGQSEEVTDTALQNAAQDLGNSAQISQVSNHYSAKDLKRVATSTASLTTYRKAMQSVLGSVNGGQDELHIIVRALETGDISAVGELGPIAVSYKNLAESVRAVPVPIGIAEYHLALMNALYGIADSFTLIAQFETDGIVGLSGVSAYKKFDTALENSLFGMQQYFIQYGIL